MKVYNILLVQIGDNVIEIFIILSEILTNIYRVSIIIFNV